MHARTHAQAHTPTSTKPGKLSAHQNFSTWKAEAGLEVLKPVWATRTLFQATNNPRTSLSPHPDFWLLRLYLSLIFKRWHLYLTWSHILTAFLFFWVVPGIKPSTPNLLGKYCGRWDGSWNQGEKTQVHLGQWQTLPCEQPWKAPSNQAGTTPNMSQISWDLQAHWEKLLHVWIITEENALKILTWLRKSQIL